MNASWYLKEDEKYGDWVEWPGGVRPISADAEVSAHLADFRIIGRIRADFLRWSKDDPHRWLAHVVAYRLILPA